MDLTDSMPGLTQSPGHRISTHSRSVCLEEKRTMSSSSFGPSQWLVAMRPWSFTAAAVPVLLGTGLASISGFWNPWLFMCTLLGAIALQAGTNLHNTYGDYVAGVDSIDSAQTCPQLVRGEISPQAMYRAGWLAFAFAGLMGLILSLVCGPFVLLFGALGVAGGYFYTNGTKPYKYSALGPYYVFFLMGPLMAVPAYMIQTGHFSASPLLGSLSIACLVSAIMHANDIRDIAHDKAAGIQTLAMQLGYARAVWVFVALNVAAFALLIFCVVVGQLPFCALLACATLPIFWRNLRAMRQPGYDIGQLEGWAAKFHMLFGVSLFAGLLVQVAVQALECA